MRADSHTDLPKVDFLCIGAQRSATSWLSKNLKACPGVWIPPLKELHYFSRSKNHPSPSHLAVQGTLRKFFGRSDEARAWRRFAFTRAPKWLMREDSANRMSCLNWILRYFFGKPSDDWYRGLFREGAGRIKGELTPAYSLLGEGDVAHIAHLFPDLKIILLMRDPVDRVLSQVRYHMDGRAEPSLHDAPDSALVAFAAAPGQLRRGNYPAILDAWLRHFPAAQVHSVFFEDISRRPSRVLDGVFHFLGIPADRHGARTAQAASRANAANRHDFSPFVHRQVAMAHEPIVRECAARFGGLATDWLVRLEGFKNVKDSKSPESAIASPGPFHD